MSEPRVAPRESAGPADAAGSIAAAVRRGLSSRPKRLPPRLFYDARGSALFEAITRLPEYYLTRTERAILAAQADAIAAAAGAGWSGRVQVAELGAGTATKSQLVLAALVRRQGPTRYWPVDVSRVALEACAERLSQELPEVTVTPLAGRHEQALVELARIGPRRLVLFIGSSIGNLTDDEASSLLGAVRGSLAPGCALLLGADRVKEPSLLLRAYDDAAGVTAAFNKNVLGRINRELGGHFDLERFAHRAVWTPNPAAIEMHLVSRGAQRVPIDALALEVAFDDGETIHTESSAKYDDARLDRILQPAGFARERDFLDERGWFGVHLCRAV